MHAHLVKSMATYECAQIEHSLATSRIQWCKGFSN